MRAGEHGAIGRTVLARRERREHGGEEVRWE
jgi:hypothetical protein